MSQSSERTASTEKDCLERIFCNLMRIHELQNADLQQGSPEANQNSIYIAQHRSYIDDDKQKLLDEHGTSFQEVTLKIQNIVIRINQNNQKIQEALENNKKLQKALRDNEELQEVLRDNEELQEVLRDNKKLQEALRDNEKLQEVLKKSMSTDPTQDRIAITLLEQLNADWRETLWDDYGLTVAAAEKLFFPASA